MGGDPLSNIASPPRLEEEKGNIMKTYYFLVPARLSYEIEAETELEALNLLVEKAGETSERGEILVDKSDYEMAELVDES